MAMAMSKSFSEAQKSDPIISSRIDNEAKEFATFIRYFCTRAVQSIVQARMGKIIPHQCHPSPDHNNWFNVVIDEIGEIAAYLKSSVNRNYPPLSGSFTLDFILYTVGGDSLPLESWVIKLDKDDNDQTVNVHSALYNQLGTLLKSIIAASRATPTFRYYVKNQGPESFIIFYRVYEGEPDLSQLGEEQKFHRLGFLPSPFGTLSVHLHYRTKMELTPNPIADENETTEELRLATDLPQTRNHLGFAVPKPDSSRVPLSPMSDALDLRLNNFSTSPLSQDTIFSDVDSKPTFTLGKSVSSTEDSVPTRHNSGSNKSDFNLSLPNGPSSFPQRSIIHKQLRSRNHSFPFSSLLLESSTDHSKLLPKVPEDAIITIGTLHPSTSDRTLNVNRPKDLRQLQKRNSLAYEVLPVSEGNLLSPGLFSDQSPLTQFPGVSGLAKNDLIDANEMGSRKGTPVRNAYDDENELSDDSFVKIAAFASYEKLEDLGNDLSEFFKEVRLAPNALSSFPTENTDILSKQLTDLKERGVQFDEFVSSLMDPEE